VNQDTQGRFTKSLSTGLVMVVLVASAQSAGKRPGAAAPDDSSKSKVAEGPSDTTEAVNNARPVDYNTAGSNPSTQASRRISMNPSSRESAGLDWEDVDVEETDFLATAYSMSGPTASGKTTRRGLIAADPHVLPLGAVVLIRAGRYSGTYRVADTGSRIKGRKIDIYMPDRREAMIFGRRSVKLKVLGARAAARARDVGEDLDAISLAK